MRVFSEAPPFFPLSNSLPTLYLLIYLPPFSFHLLPFLPRAIINKGVSPEFSKSFLLNCILKLSIRFTEAMPSLTSVRITISPDRLLPSVSQVLCFYDSKQLKKKEVSNFNVCECTGELIKPPFLDLALRHPGRAGIGRT